MHQRPFQRPYVIEKTKTLGLGVFAGKLFISAIPQIFREVRQPHQNNSQSSYVGDIDFSRKHPGYYNRHKKADNRPYKKHLELIQYIILLKTDSLN